MTAREPRDLRSHFEAHEMETDDIDDIFARLIDRPWRRGHGRVTAWPAVDLYEVAGEYILVADLPGVAPGDIEMHIDGRRLTLCGYRFGMGFARDAHGLRIERASGSFCRTFFLDEAVDTTRIEKGYENGIYWARVPKRPRQMEGETGRS